MERNWWHYNGDMVIDIALYLLWAVGLAWITKLISDARQERRDRKAAELIYQQREEERLLEKKQPESD